jgi:dephospho-CoA kinase
VVRASFTGVQEQGIEIFTEDVQESIRESSSESEVIPSDGSSRAIGEWVTMMLDIHNTVFAKQAIEQIVQMDEDVIVVDGIRTLADVSEFETAFDTFVLLHLYSPFAVRAERIIERGREGEDEFGVMDVLERDERELDWGVDDILTEKPSYTFYNNYNSVDEFQAEFVEFATEVLSRKN